MKIALNATIANPSQTGTGQYAANLTAALMQADHDHELVVYCDRQMVDWFGDRRNGRAVRLKAVDVRSAAQRIVWEQTHLAPDLARERVHLLHGLAFTAPLRTVTRYVVTVHDLAFRRYPQTLTRARRWYYRWLFPRVLRAAKCVITPTETIRHEVLEAFNLQRNAVIAAHGGAGELFKRTPNPSEVEDACVRLGVPRPYVLAVGTLEPRKNLEMAVQAFLAARAAAHLPHRLVLVGKTGPERATRARLARRAHDSDAVVFTGYVEAEQLPALYAGADLLLFPSLYEGLGLPLLEAFHAGVAVLASDLPVHREVCGDAAWFAPPREPERWQHAIAQLLSQPARRAALVAKGQRRARAFSWQAAAEKTLAVYEMAGQTFERFRT